MSRGTGKRVLDAAGTTFGIVVVTLVGLLAASTLIAALVWVWRFILGV